MKSRTSSVEGFTSKAMQVVRVVFLLGVIGSTWAEADVFTVGVSGHDHTTIAAAVAAANDGDFIVVMDAVHTEAGINFTKSIGIYGGGPAYTTVQGHASAGSAGDRVFTVAAGKTVLIEGITIRHGYADGGNGAGVLNSGTLRMRRCAISDNEARNSGMSGGYGGGIYNEGTLTMENCTISNNVASNTGKGGGIYNETGTVLELVGCAISNNTADDEGGGIRESGGTATLKRCTVSGNNAGYTGGALFVGTAAVVNCTISGNTATRYGGGINSEAGATTVTNCTITDNTCANHSGGIVVRAGALTLKNSIVAVNTNGGGAGDVQLTDAGSVTTDGYNLIGDNSGITGVFPAGTPNGNDDWAGTGVSPVDPLINALADNGGATQTHELQLASPAIDKIPNGVNGMGADPLDVDQREAARPYNTNGDIGAFEYTVFVNAPTNLGPASCVDGSIITDAQPTLTFTQSDPQGDNVKYRIQIDDAGDFSTPVTDYTSAFAAAGSSSFTVGQTVSGGTYTVSGPGQDLAPGDYYWRVCTADSGATSDWTTANGGGVAFSVIDYAAVTTNSVSAITGTTATGGGGIMDDGGSAVTARGVCWNTTGAPDTGDANTSDGSGSGGFTSSLTGLALGETYYVRAYATNGAGTAYGAEKTFTTLDIPTVTTAAITGVTTSTADSGGDVSDDGGDAVTARGVCWRAGAIPTIVHYKTTDGSGTGQFASDMDNLAPSTKYYVRAYAENGVGVGYGAARSFTTGVVAAPDLTVKVAAAEQTADVGDEISFEVDVANIGNGSASNVVLRFPLPSGTEFVGAWLTGGQSGQAAALNAYTDGDEIVVELGDVDASEDLKLEVVLTAKAAGAVTLSASASSNELSAPVTAPAAGVEVADATIGNITAPGPLCGWLGVTPALMLAGLMGMKRRGAGTGRRRGR